MKTTIHTGIILRPNGDGFRVAYLPEGVEVIEIKNIYKDGFGEYRGTVTVSSLLEVIDTSQEPGYSRNWDRVFIKVK